MEFIKSNIQVFERLKFPQILFFSLVKYRGVQVIRTIEIDGLHEHPCIVSRLNTVGTLKF